MRKYVIAFMTTSYEDTLREHTFGILDKVFDTQEEAKVEVAERLKTFQEEYIKDKDKDKDVIECSVDGYYFNKYYYIDFEILVRGELVLFYQYKIMEIKV